MNYLPVPGYTIDVNRLWTPPSVFPTRMLDSLDDQLAYQAKTGLPINPVTANEAFGRSRRFSAAGVLDPNYVAAPGTGTDADAPTRHGSSSSSLLRLWRSDGTGIDTAVVRDLLLHELPRAVWALLSAAAIKIYCSLLLVHLQIGLTFCIYALDWWEEVVCYGFFILLLWSFYSLVVWLPFGLMETAISLGWYLSGLDIFQVGSNLKSGVGTCEWAWAL